MPPTTISRLGRCQWAGLQGSPHTGNYIYTLHAVALLNLEQLEPPDSHCCSIAQERGEGHDTVCHITAPQTDHCSPVTTHVHIVFYYALLAVFFPFYRVFLSAGACGRPPGPCSSSNELFAMTMRCSTSAAVRHNVVFGVSGAWLAGCVQVRASSMHAWGTTPMMALLPHGGRRMRVYDSHQLSRQAGGLRVIVHVSFAGYADGRAAPRVAVPTYLVARGSALTDGSS
jgi:hypothetical protein